MARLWMFLKQSTDLRTTKQTSFSINSIFHLELFKIISTNADVNADVNTDVSNFIPSSFSS
jgi:hypothetical protein